MLLIKKYHFRFVIISILLALGYVITGCTKFQYYGDENGGLSFSLAPPNLSFQFYVHDDTNLVVTLYNGRANEYLIDSLSFSIDGKPANNLKIRPVASDTINVSDNNDLRIKLDSLKKTGRSTYSIENYDYRKPDKDKIKVDMYCSFYVKDNLKIIDTTLVLEHNVYRRIGIAH